jgi:hypothetical protein
MTSEATSDLISSPPGRALRRKCYCPFESLQWLKDEFHCGRTRGAMSIESCQLSAFSYQLSAISYQPSALAIIACGKCLAV